MHGIRIGGVRAALLSGTSWFLGVGGYVALSEYEYRGGKATRPIKVKVLKHHATKKVAG